MEIIRLMSFLLLLATSRATDYLSGYNDELFDRPKTDPGFIGDMKLTEEQLDAIERGDDVAPSGRQRRAIRNSATYRWHGGIIPYNIDCSLKRMPTAISAIKAAMEEWENSTCIRFVPRTDEQDYLTFFRGTHCWGYVGRIGGESKISVGPFCDYQHVMTHEIGHVVGFYHEQNRMDRDDNVEVFWENIPESSHRSFKKLTNTYSLGVPYDYSSIMHYPWTAFSKNGKVTMRPRKRVKSPPYKHLSNSDALQTSLMYKCDNNVVVDESVGTDVPCADKTLSCKIWAKKGYCKLSELVWKDCASTCQPRCKNVTPATTPAPCSNRRQDSTCTFWADHGYCELNSKVRRFLCCKTCLNYTEDAESIPEPPTLGYGRLCIDRQNYCTRKAATGYCQKYPQYMHLYCPVACKIKACDPKPVRPPGSCANPLGIGFDGTGWKIPDSSMTSNSVYTVGEWTAYASNARLYYTGDYVDKRMAAWCTKYRNDTKADKYLQVDLGELKTIQYIATQGRYKYHERVSMFKVKYSVDGLTWSDYEEDGEVRKFRGNCDHFTPVLNKFNNLIKARYFRYYPTKANFPCMRMELYGC